TRGDDSPNMVWRPFYFANLVVDPNDPDRVYKPDGAFLASEDAAKSFQNASNGIHGDVHDLWIDPNDSNEIVMGDDGGIFYSHDGFYTFEDPRDPSYLYSESQGGYVARVNKRTHEVRDIKPRAEKGEKLRFHWNTPVVASPNEKGTIYMGGQFLFRSRDHGQ